MRRLIMMGAGFVAISAAASAGTITNGNASFQMVGSPVFNSTTGDANLITDTGASDQAFKYTWYYRTPNNNTNRLFSSLDTPTEAAIGDTDTIGYTNAGPGASGIERFNATFTIKLIDDLVNPNTVDVTCALLVSNPNSGTVTYNFFNLIDLDVTATATNDTASITDLNGVRARQTDGSTSNFAEALGVGATRYEINTGANLRAKLNSGSANLSNAVGPLTGDEAIGFQWTVTLAPGQSTTIYSGFSINKSAIPEPGSLVLMGVGLAALLGRRGR